MSDYRYPADDLDRSPVLLASLGTFWSQLYEGNALVELLMQARAREQQQTNQDMEELLAILNRYTLPLTHRDNWHPLTLRAGELNQTAALLRYGEGAVFGNQPESGRLYKFGVPAPNSGFAFPLPDKLVRAPLVCNRLRTPTRTLTENVDYLLLPEHEAVLFRDNPFDDPDLVVSPVMDEQGVVIDTTATLWIFRGEFDERWLDRHLGSLLGLRHASTPAYRQLLNALLDAVIMGTARKQIEDIVAALTGVPSVQADGETVEVVTQDAYGRLVITDQRAYRFASAATPVVTVGQELAAGAALVDAVVFYEFQRGEAPDELMSLALPRSFLPQAYKADLAFHNITVPLVVEEDVAGYTKVSFRIDGLAEDIERFWNDLHTAGVAAGKTLAQYLDLRAEPDGQPTAESLPATINPLKFLLGQVLRNHGWAVQIQANSMTTDGLGLQQARWLRKILPAHSFLFILVQLAATEDPISMDGAGDDVTPGYTEDPEEGIGLETEDDEVTVDQVQEEEPVLSQVTDPCELS